MKHKEHHIWCNYYHQPVEGCKMCERLRREYPEDYSLDEMSKKYFPDVKLRPNIGTKK